LALLKGGGQPEKLCFEEGPRQRRKEKSQTIQRRIKKCVLVAREQAMGVGRGRDMGEHIEVTRGRKGFARK